MLLGVLTGIGAMIAPACAPAPMRGERVEIAEETALIVWDEANKTEHFIRQAKFMSTSADFGFLVPTPSEPKLAESDEAAFRYLATLTAPKIEYRTVKQPRPKRSDEPQSMARAGGGVASAPPGIRGVEVLQHTEVGGMEAVVLKFNRGGAQDDPTADARELAGWLAKRGYEFGPQIAAWLKPYIANDWVMTAFRIAKSVPVSAGPAPKTDRNAIHEMQGKPILMSFKTDRPFYPYREPVAEKPKENNTVPHAGPMTSFRFLRVFLIAPERFSGMLGTGSTSWVGTTAHSEKLTEEQAKKAAEWAKLPGPLPPGAWLTEFEDRSTPRQGTDEVYFGPSTIKEPVLRPPIIRDVIEYYDPPDPEANWETPYAVKLAAVIGGVFFVAVLAGLLFVIFRNRS